MENFLFQQSTGIVVATVVIVAVFLFIILRLVKYIIKKYWIEKRYKMWLRKQKFVLLAVDIPRDNTRTPQAVEQILATLWGSYTPVDWRDILWYGRRQLPYSFEIVSLGGYIQFLIYTPAEYRDLVESAIYSQYPDTEIIEVEDYTQYSPDKLPVKGWSMWGCEFELAKNFAYPLKTYTKFEHKGAREFSDPLAGILEIFSKIKKGEQIWFQIIVSPIDDNWQNEVQMEAKILSKVEGTVRKKKGIGSLFSFRNKYQEASSISNSDFYQASDGQNLPSYIQYLTPGEKSVIEAVQNKASKTGFLTTIRYIYIARDECFSKARGIAGVIGAMKQFSSPDMNSLVPSSRASVVRSGIRAGKNFISVQNKLLSAYKIRQLGITGRTRFVLNTEEIATIWHFPGDDVKVPFVKKTEFKVLDPPVNLPVLNRGIYNGGSGIPDRSSNSLPAGNMNILRGAGNKY